MGHVLQLEFVPYINRIISPPLRPVSVLSSSSAPKSRFSLLQVNSQVIKTEERALLARLVEIMVSLALRFVQERTEDGQVVYRLDPYVPPRSYFGCHLRESIGQ